MHPPGLPHQVDNLGNLRVGWHGLTCGASAEVCIIGFGYIVLKKDL